MTASKAIFGRGRPFLGLLLIAPPLLLVAVLLLFPAIGSIVGTLQRTAPDGGLEWTLEGYRKFFSDPFSLHNLGYTLWATIVTSALLIAVNLPIALYLRFRSNRLAPLIQTLALFPMFVPGIVISYALIQYLGPNGLLQSLLEHVGFRWYHTPYLTPWGPVFGMLWDSMPFTLLVLTAGAAGISTASVEAARDLGAGPLRVLVSIILPQIGNSLLVVTALNFYGLFSSVLQPFLLGPATPEMMGPFMLRTFASVRDPATAAVQATVTFLICSLAGFFYVRSIARRNRDEAHP